MSFELPSQRTRARTRPAWAGAAFIVEAMLLLAFLLASLAIFTQLFATSARDSADSQRLSQAVALATAQAERFADDPASANGMQESDGLRVECSVLPTSRTSGGILYKADITVYDDALSQEVYKITTAHYVNAADEAGETTDNASAAGTTSTTGATSGSAATGATSTTSGSGVNG